MPALCRVKPGIAWHNEAKSSAIGRGSLPTKRAFDAAQVHFVSAIHNVTVPAEVAEFTALDGDLIEGLEVIDGSVPVPTGPGLGIRLNVY